MKHYSCPRVFFSAFLLVALCGSTVVAATAVSSSGSWGVSLASPPDASQGYRIYLPIILRSGGVTPMRTPTATSTATRAHTPTRTLIPTVTRTPGPSRTPVVPVTGWWEGDGIKFYVWSNGTRVRDIEALTGCGWLRPSVTEEIYDGEFWVWEWEGEGDYEIICEFTSPRMAEGTTWDNRDWECWDYEHDWTATPR